MFKQLAKILLVVIICADVLLFCGPQAKPTTTRKAPAKEQVFDVGTVPRGTHIASNKEYDKPEGSALNLFLLILFGH
jgi:hypothetical protein